MISIKYCGTFLDHSGYGSSNRADISAFYVAGVNMTTELVVQVPEKTSHGIAESIASSMRDREIDYKIKIIHLTPDMYPRYMEANKYNIGRLVWETDRLPQEWINPCNKMAEIWTTSERHKKILETSGIKVPIYSFPEPIDTLPGLQKINPFQTKFKKDFIFYSIFQWIDRKNARGLLRAYWKAFEGNENVTLLLKTYRNNYSEDQYTQIRNDILEWKSQLGLQHYPKILLVKKLLKSSDLPKLHEMGDVFVNPSSGEGWCRPMQEAMLQGKPVISGDNGGITDYLSSDEYTRVSTSLQRATEASWIPWYTKDMHWWVLDEKDFIKSLKQVYSSYQEALEKANRAKSYVIEKTSYQYVGNLMKERLESIYKFL